MNRKRVGDTIRCEWMRFFSGLALGTDEICSEIETKIIPLKHLAHVLVLVLEPSTELFTSLPKSLSEASLISRKLR